MPAPSAGREHRHEEEDRHRERQLLGHLRAAMAITDHRRRRHPQARRANAPHEAGEVDHRQRRRDRGG